MSTFVGEAGGALQNTTTAAISIASAMTAGAEMGHVVTVQGGTSTVTLAAGGELRAVTRKFVASDAVPGGLGRLGVGV